MWSGTKTESTSLLISSGVCDSMPLRGHVAHPVLNGRDFNVPIEVAEKTIRHKKLWVDSGSGSLPSE